MTELEDRLRADLPRLGELIAQRPDEELPTPVSRRERPPGRRRAIATAIAICVLLGGVTAVAGTRSGHTHAPASRPRVVIRDPWRSLPPSPLGPRANAVAVWTGDDVLVWGGYRGNPATPLALQSGAAYHPTTKLWSKIADNQWAHPGAVGVWAEDRLYILAKNGGAKYNPTTNAWRDIARLPDGSGGGFRAAAWTGTTLFGVLAEREVGTIAVARYDNGRNEWTIGKSLRASSQADQNSVSTVWTGKELVVSDGASSVWAYDPTTDAWRALASLSQSATSSSITSIGGKLVAVYVADDRLRAARAVGSRWRTIADSPHTPITQPIAIDAGGTLVAIDRSGRSTPQRVDPSTGRWVSLDGYPLSPGLSGAAVWASTGLFVWGGLPSGTPASFSNPTPNKPDAAWYQP
jgi:N-acetylneuraminic acid mutarotase